MYGKVIEEENKTFTLSSAFASVFGWMTFALLVSGGVAFAIGTDRALIQKIFVSPSTLIFCIIIEFALVSVISFFINKLSASVATALFALYAAVNGVTLSTIFIVYQLPDIYITFLICAGMFGVMSAIGAFTKYDLSKLGTILFLGLIGLIIASVINFFTRSEMAEWIISLLGVIIFTGLTAYDVQKIKALYYSVPQNREMHRKVAIIGALQLYLDFINLFLYLLRLFGRRR